MAIDEELAKMNELVCLPNILAEFSAGGTECL